MYKVDDLLRWTQVVEDEFGLEWLQKRVNKAQQRGRDVLHPGARGWLQLRGLLASLQSTTTPVLSQELIAFIDFANDLSAVRGLPHYDVAIRTKLKTVDTATLSKVQYEAHVAALGVLSRYNVEFVPQSEASGERTPDLILTGGACDFYAECKRKDAYAPPTSTSDDVWQSLQDQILKSARELNAFYQIVVVALGQLEQKNSAEVLEGVRQFLSEKREGNFVSKDLGIALSIQKLGHNKIVPHPDWANPGVTEAITKVDEAGKFYFDDFIRVALYRIDSHRLSSILASFNQARGQVPIDAVGLIYIDLDVTQVSIADIFIYLDAIGSALQALFTPTSNTRIGAIVLTTGPLLVPTDQNGRQIQNIGHYLRVVRNPHSSLPGNCLIPGERPPLTGVLTLAF
jgi:hypothetical protein